MSTPTTAQFVAVAKILDANVAPLPLVQDFADYFGEQNPRFDRRRFILAATRSLVVQQHSDHTILNRETREN